MFQMNLPKMNAIAQEMIRHFFAGQLNAIIRTSVVKMGKNASSANISILLSLNYIVNKEYSTKSESQSQW